LRLLADDTVVRLEQERRLSDGDGGDGDGGAR